MEQRYNKKTRAAWARGEGQTNISGAVNTVAGLEITTVELIDGRSQVGGGLEFDKSVTRYADGGTSRLASDLSARESESTLGLPSALAVSRGLGVNNVEAGLTSKVLEVLCRAACVSRDPGEASGAQQSSAIGPEIKKGASHQGKGTMCC